MRPRSAGLMPGRSGSATTRPGTHPMMKNAVPITESSSQSAKVRGTGTVVLASAVMMRYSRSTACAEGSSLPRGLRRSTYSPPGDASPSRGFALPALDLVAVARPLEAGDVLGHVALERLHVEAVRLAHRHGIGGGHDLGAGGGVGGGAARAAAGSRRAACGER